MSSFKTHFKSWVITFIGIFIPTVLPALGDLTFTHAALVAFALACFRSAVKILGEMFAMKTA